jgi:ABC-2 type transport system permease protein
VSVLDRGYRRWQGTPTPYWWRILVMPRYDFDEVVRRRVWLMACLGCLAPPLVLGGMTYLFANVGVLRQMGVPLPADWSLPLPGLELYAAFTTIQLYACTGLALLVGPQLMTRDFANSAIPLYLSKALRRTDYVLGRWTALLVLLSLVTWVPYLLDWLLSVGLAPPAWREQNSWLPLRIVWGFVPAIVLLTAVVSATCACVHRSNVARAALLGLFVITFIFAGVLSTGSHSVYGEVVSPMRMAATLHERAFTPPAAEEPTLERTREPGRRPEPHPPATSVPAPVAAIVLLGWIGGAILVLRARVRPVEVVA